jgi:hypothetical protein
VPRHCVIQLQSSAKLLPGKALVLPMMAMTALQHDIVFWGLPWPAGACLVSNFYPPIPVLTVIPTRLKGGNKSEHALNRVFSLNKFALNDQVASH